MNLYGIPIDVLAKGGMDVLLLAAVIVIWRQLTALQTRYEAVLERSIAALTKVYEYLDKHEE